MKKGNCPLFLVATLMGLAGFALISGCDRGEKVLDEVTGNRAVKQYHRSKKDIERIEDQQAERYKSIPDEEREDKEQR